MILIFIKSLYWSLLVFLQAQTVNQDFNQRSQQRTIQDVVVACRGFKLDHLQNRFQEAKICQFIIELEQMGADLIEMVKRWLEPGPFEYFLLTVINYSATGRLRFDVQPFLYSRLRGTVEFRQEGELWILLSAEW